MRHRGSNQMWLFLLLGIVLIAAGSRTPSMFGITFIGPLMIYLGLLLYLIGILFSFVVGIDVYKRVTKLRIKKDEDN